MSDLSIVSSSAFSDRPSSRHVNPAGWPSTVAGSLSQRRIGSSTLEPVAGVGFHRSFSFLIEPHGGLEGAGAPGCERPTRKSKDMTEAGELEDGTVGTLSMSTYW